MSAKLSAKRLTASLAAGAMIAALTMASPAAALNQKERNIVGGIALGVLGTLAIQGAKKNKSHSTTRVCHNPYQTYRNGRLVTVCR